MTFAPVGSLIQSANSNTFSLTPGAVGDLILLEVIAIDGTFTASTLSSTNVTWLQMAAFTGTLNSWGAVLFQGVVTSTSTATVTITWTSSASTNFRVAGQEFSSSAGAWAMYVQGHIDSGSASLWAALTPAAAGELYFGYAINQASAVAGSTPGYTYDIDAHSNGLAYNASCTAAVQQPAWGDSTQALGIMVLLREVNFSTASPTGLFPTPDHLYEVSADAFNSGLAPFLGQWTWANNENDWGAQVIVTAAGNTVYTFPDVTRLYELYLANTASIICNYATTMPTTAGGFVGETQFDCWLNGAGPGFGDEVSLFVNNSGVGSGGDTLLASGLTFSGNSLTWSAYERTGSNPPQFIFVPNINQPSGSIDLLPFFTWLSVHGYMVNPSTLTAIELGMEVVTGTGQPSNFSCTQFSLSTGLEQGPSFGQQSGIFETTGTALPLNPQHVGDVILAAVIAESSTVKATSVSGGGCTWQVIAGPFLGTSQAYYVTLFAGTVVTAGPSAATITYSGATPTVRGVAMEFSAPAGWTVSQAGFIDNTSGQAAFPSLGAPRPGSLYFGYAYNNGSGAGGTTPGVVFGQDSHLNNWLFDANAATGFLAPVTGDAGNAIGVAVMLAGPPSAGGPGLADSDRPWLKRRRAKWHKRGYPLDWWYGSEIPAVVASPHPPGGRVDDIWQDDAAPAMAAPVPVSADLPDASGFPDQRVRRRPVFGVRRRGRNRESRPVRARNAVVPAAGGAIDQHRGERLIDSYRLPRARWSGTGEYPFPVVQRRQ